MKSKLFFIAFNLFFINAFAQNITFEELKKSVSKIKGDEYAEQLLNKGFSFVKKNEEDFSSTFAFNYNGTEQTADIWTYIYTWDFITFKFYSNKKSLYLNLLNQIKSNCTKESFKFDKHLNTYVTKYVSKDGIKFLIYTNPASENNPESFSIGIIRKIQDKNSYSAGEIYNNTYFY